MRRVLVTGGAGYIGSCVVDELVRRGHRPIVFDSFFWGKEGVEQLGNSIDMVEGDARSSRDLIYALRECDSVIHLAGIVGEPACAKNELAHFTTNVESTNTLLSCMTDPEAPLVQDLIFSSSCSVYGNVAGIFDEVSETTPTMPLSAYAQGKLRAEEAIFECAARVPHLSPTVLRLTTIFGWSRKPRLDLVTNYFAYLALTKGQLKIFGDGLQYRSLIHVRDVANAMVTALEAPRYLRDRQIFHVGEEANNVTVKHLAETVQKYVPGTEILYLEEENTDRRDYRISCNKIKNSLNWRAAYSVEDGIREMVENLRDGKIEATAPQYWNNQFEYV